MRRSAAKNHDTCLHVCMRIPEVLPWAVHVLSGFSTREERKEPRSVRARALGSTGVRSPVHNVQLYHWSVNGSRYESGHVVAVSRER